MNVYTNYPKKTFLINNGGFTINVYDIVTERILEKLRQGEIPWKKPWVDIPVSGISGKPYTGINLFLLSKAGEYFTINEIKRLRASLKENYTTEIIVFFKSYEKLDKITGEKTVSKVLQYYKVYHISDIEGIRPKIQEAAPKIPLVEAEKIVNQYNKVPVFHRESSAYYNRKEDYINLPPIETFNSPINYYLVRFHEITHSTGYKSRLDRFPENSPMVFGNTEYSKEELIAELGAAMLASEAGIDEMTIDNSAAYIQAWISRLENDHRLIVSAASKAKQAVNYILDRKETA